MVSNRVNVSGDHTWYPVYFRPRTVLPEQMPLISFSMFLCGMTLRMEYRNLLFAAFDISAYGAVK